MTQFGYYVTNAKEIMEENSNGLGTTGVVLYEATNEDDARKWASKNNVVLGGNQIRGEEGRAAYYKALGV